MSQNDSPVTPVFEFQRTAIEQTHRVFQRSVEFQQSVNGAFVDGFDSAADVSERGNDLLRRSVDAYLDAVETTVPGGADVVADVRENVDEQFDTLEESQSEALETIEANLKEGSESVDELLEDFLDQLDEQVQSLLETSESLEDQTVEALEELETQIDELQTQIDEQTEQLQSQVEEATEQVGDTVA